MDFGVWLDLDANPSVLFTGLSVLVSVTLNFHTCKIEIIASTGWNTVRAKRVAVIVAASLFKY